MQLSTIPNILPRRAKPQRTTEVLPVSCQECFPCLTEKHPIIWLTSQPPISSPYTPMAPHSPLKTPLNAAKNRNDTLAAAPPVSITGPGRGVCCWLNPQCETEQLGWIFGCKRFLLLFLAARLPSGPREGCTTAHHRHMAEGKLVRLKVMGGQSNLLTCGWFIIPWGDVALLGPERERVRGRTVSVAFVSGYIKWRFLGLGEKLESPEDFKIWGTLKTWNRSINIDLRCCSLYQSPIFSSWLRYIGTTSAISQMCFSASVSVS